MYFKIILFALLFPFFATAQSHRFMYSYTFVPDSTKKDSTITELTRLDVFPNHSEFLSDVTAKKDSAIMMSAKNNQGQETIKLPNGIYQNKTSRGNDDAVYTIEYIGIQPFKVMRKTKPEWKLSNETKKIEGYSCQKATTTLGNREWIAWFTQEIPVQDGPYLFSGLPGLIVQVNDTQNQHIFTLKGNYRIPKGSTNIYSRPLFDPVETTETVFNKKWNDFRKNPLGGTEQFMIMNPGLLSGESYDKNGNKSLVIERTKQERQYAKKQLESNNNPLDLQLYKIN